MFVRLWRLLDAGERRRMVGIIPLLVLSAFVEVVGVATIIPFLTLLVDPGSVADLPLIGTWLDSVRGEGIATARWVALAFALVLVLANALVMLTHWWRLRFSWGINHAVSMRLLRHYLSQPYARHVVRNSAELQNRLIVEVRQVMEQGFRALLEIVTRGAVIVALVGFLIVLDPMTALVAVGGVGGSYALVYVLTRRYLRRIGRASVAAGNERMKAAKEGLDGLRDLRLVGREASALRAYRGPSRRYADVKAASAAISELPRSALEAVAVGGFVVIAGLQAGRDGGLGAMLPTLGAYAFAGLRLMPAAQALFHHLARLRFSTGSLEALEADFAERDDVETDLDVPVSVPRFRHAIELRDVTVRYEGETEPALEGVSFVVRHRSTVGVLGRTGSGKSTLAEVLFGLLIPQRGAVLLDGRPVDRSDLRSYRSLFGYVPQSVFLLDDTVTRNVAFGVPDDEIDHDAVRRACAQAQVADVVERLLPHRFETLLGENGVRLSGGQRQRIGIARALYHQPAVLVFDEATSALDVHTERTVYEALAAIARERTLVVITHRLETVAFADHLVVLESGRIVDQGAPGAVLERYRAEGAVEA